MSGKFAQYVACRAPGRVVGQILVAGCPASAVPLSEDLIRDWSSRAGNRAKLIEVTCMFLSLPVAQEILDRFGIDAERVPASVLEQALRMWREVDFSSEVQGIDAPSLVVGGIHDAIFPPDALRHAVAAPLRRARLVLLPCNHEIPIEMPEELARLVEAFLAGLAI